MPEWNEKQTDRPPEYRCTPCDDNMGGHSSIEWVFNASSRDDLRGASVGTLA